MKLTPENIKFIDNYLKNSEVVYYDIRMEMLDHVASAVEQKMEAENLDFYDAFKSYMVLNKKDLISQNEKTQKFNYSILIVFFKFCIKPISVLLFTTSCVLFYVLIQFYSITFISRVFINASFLGMLALFVFYGIVYHLIKKRRFYSIEKNGVVQFFLYQILFFLNNVFILGNKEEISKILSIIIIFIVSLYFNFIFFYVSELKKTERLNKKLFQ